MLRNIRRFYWKQRDRGQGRKTVMGVLVFFLFVAIIVAAIIKSMMGGHHAGLQTVHKTNTATGVAVVTETASGASVAATETAPDRELPQETKEAISVDTTNLNTFLGFMSDAAYEDLKNQLIQICQDRKCRSVKKLTYYYLHNIRRQWYGRCWRQEDCISEPERRCTSMNEVSVFFGK